MHEGPIITAITAARGGQFVHHRDEAEVIGFGDRVGDLALSR
ncbi:MAG: hypothetical protein V3V97_22260 [Hyphomicrobiaceae bacterium]